MTSFDEDDDRWQKGTAGATPNPVRAPAIDPRPPIEIGNVWRHEHQPNQIHYMIYWTDGHGHLQSRHLVELDGTALAKILETRIR